MSRPCLYSSPEPSKEGQSSSSLMLPPTRKVHPLVSRCGTDIKFNTDFPPDMKKAIETYESVELGERMATLPEVDRDLAYHPEGCLDTPLKHEMYYIYETLGSEGLAHKMIQYARDRIASGDNMFKYFVHGREDETGYLPLLLTTIHPEVVKAVICGNLAYRYFNDSIFKDTVVRTTTPTTTPGIYFNQMYDCGTNVEAEAQGSSPSQTVPNNTGKGFSYNDWQIIHDAIVVYRSTSIGSGAQKRVNQNSLALAKKVDHKYYADLEKETVDHRSHPYQRRFLPEGKNQRQQKLDKFLETLNHRVLIPGGELSDERKSDPAHWSVFEIGYSHNALQRLKGHIGDESTNFLWGLLCAIVEVKFPKRFKILQGQLVYICDKEHSNLAEAMCSVLASSYHDMMGCNPERAGKIPSTDTALAPRGYRDNIDLLFKPVGSLSNAFQKGCEHNRNATQRLKEWRVNNERHSIEQAETDAEEERKVLLARVEEQRKKANGLQYAAAQKDLTEIVRRLVERQRTRAAGTPPPPSDDELAA